MKKITFIFISAAFLASFFISCTTTTNAGAVGADRSQIMLVSEKEVNEASKQAYDEVLEEAKKAGTLNKDPATLKRVKNIADKLIAQTGTFREDALNWNWEVNVITEETINAWCMAGGKIVVYTGIIESLNLTDAQLAAVMGHEIAHALREHSRERASRSTITNVGVSILSAAAGLNETGTALASKAAEVGLTLPFSRSNETEADHIGTELMARAGYDPNEAVRIWEKMNELGGSSTPQLLSTHPSNKSRINDLKVIAEKVYPLYEAAKK